MKKLKLNLGYYALVDDEDFDRVSIKKWYIQGMNNKEKKFYVIANLPREGAQKGSIRLHQFIIGIHLNKSIIIDHINGNPLDNRKCNLRFVNKNQNLFNRIPANDRKFKGVFKKKNRYISCIRFKKKLIYLGRFKTEIEAASVYNKKAKELFGEYAYLNKV